MHFSQFAAIFALVVGHTLATGYGGGGFPSGGGGYVGGGAGRGGAGGGYVGGAGGSYVGGQNFAPKPYDFDYQARDEFGNVHYRQEQGDQSGNVKGSYGYTDVNGLYRVVDYVADANGYRASIRTNEPGVGEDSPADVSLTAAAPPAGIQERYTRVGGAGSYSGGGGTYSGGAGVHSGSGAHGSSHYGGAGHRFGGAGIKSGKSGY